MKFEIDHLRKKNCEMFELIKNKYGSVKTTFYFDLINMKKILIIVINGD